jgi:Thioredoxin-like
MSFLREPCVGQAETAKSSSRKTLPAVAVALVASVTLNVLMAHRVRSLTYVRSARIAEYQLKVGTVVPPIAVKRLGGQQEVISYQGINRSTVLYVFTPPCSWCARNMDNFKTLLRKESGEYRFIALSMSEDTLAEYVAKNDLKLPVYSGLSMDSKAAYKLSGTPQTIVVSPDGRVLQNWMGAYIGDQKSQVEAFFHIKLPGLRDVPKQAANDNGQAASQQAN